MITTKSEITVKAMMELDEQQMRALDALAGYGTDPFISAFYKVMGEGYLKPHEPGLVLLFNQIRKAITPSLAELDKYRYDQRERAKKRKDANHD